MRPYHQELEKRGIRQSMSRKGNCLDNSPMENFFGVINDPALMKSTLEAVFDNLSTEGVGIRKATVSPIKGHKGNTEFLALLEERSPDDDGLWLDCEGFLGACGV